MEAGRKRLLLRGDDSGSVSARTLWARPQSHSLTRLQGRSGNEFSFMLRVEELDFMTY